MIFTPRKMAWSNDSSCLSDSLQAFCEEASDDNTVPAAAENSAGRCSQAFPTYSTTSVAVNTADKCVLWITAEVAVLGIGIKSGLM